MIPIESTEALSHVTISDYKKLDPCSIRIQNSTFGFDMRYLDAPDVSVDLGVLPGSGGADIMDRSGAGSYLQVDSNGTSSVVMIYRGFVFDSGVFGDAGMAGMDSAHRLSAAISAVDPNDSSQLTIGKGLRLNVLDAEGLPATHHSSGIVVRALFDTDAHEDKGIVYGRNRRKADPLNAHDLDKALSSKSRPGEAVNLKKAFELLATKNGIADPRGIIDKLAEQSIATKDAGEVQSDSIERAKRVSRALLKFRGR